MSSATIQDVRKKPVVVKATHFVNPDSAKAIAAWCGGEVVDESGTPAIVIQTLEGPMTARLGWWVIKGIKGEFYPCENEIMQGSYEFTW